MTKREILEQLRLCSINVNDRLIKVGDRWKALVRDLEADVKAEETPRHPEDDGSEEVRSLGDVSRRLEAIYSRLVEADADTVSRVMVKALKDDVGSADWRAESDVEGRPRPIGPVFISGLPAGATVTVRLAGEATS